MTNRLLQIVLVIIILVLAIGIPAASLVVNAPNSDASRWKHHVYAETRGYEWIECPVCGVEFGTHEIDQSPEFLSPAANGGLGPVSPCCAEAVASLKADGEELTPEAILARRAELASASEQPN